MVHITPKKLSCRFIEQHLTAVEVFAAFLHFRHKFLSISCKSAVTSFCINNREYWIPIPVSCFNSVTIVAYCLCFLKFFSLEYHSEIQKIFNLHFTDENWEQIQRHLAGVQKRDVPLPFEAYTKSMSCKASYISAFLTSLEWYKYTHWYTSAILHIFRKSHHLEVGSGSINLWFSLIQLKVVGIVGMPVKDKIWYFNYGMDEKEVPKS